MYAHKIWFNYLHRCSVHTWKSYLIFIGHGHSPNFTARKNSVIKLDIFQQRDHLLFLTMLFFRKSLIAVDHEGVSNVNYFFYNTNKEDWYYLVTLCNICYPLKYSKYVYIGLSTLIVFGVCNICSCFVESITSTKNWWMFSCDVTLLLLEKEITEVVSTLPECVLLHTLMLKDPIIVDSRKILKLDFLSINTEEYYVIFVSYHLCRYILIVLRKYPSMLGKITSIMFLMRVCFQFIQFFYMFKFYCVYLLIK